MDKFKLDINKGIYLKNHIIKFEPESKSLLLYDLKGVLLDKKSIEFLIDGICIIDDNYILIRYINKIIIKIKIVNNSIEINDKLFINQRIYDFIYIKESRLLIISFEKNIGIWDIDSLLNYPIQIINSKSHNLFKFNSNLFISYDNTSISIYQKTNNIKLYQFSSILTLDNNNITNKLNLIKLDNRTLLIAKTNKIYLIDIRNMMVKQKYKIINGKGGIKSLYVQDKKIYLNFGNYLYTTTYNKYNLEIINKMKKSELEWEEYSYPKLGSFIVVLENKNILKYKEPFKFISLKDNKYFVFPVLEYMFDKGLLYNLKQELEETKLMYKKIEYSNYIRKFDENKIEGIIEIKKSKNYPIITNKRNYDKRRKFKKINKIKNEKIRNNPRKFKKEFR